jgi:hypothetical protein
MNELPGNTKGSSTGGWILESGTQEGDQGEERHQLTYTPDSHSVRDCSKTVT